jgi:glucosinolate gamma-glutamyl hydrolase
MYKKQILILNLLYETSLKTSFDKRIAEVFQTIDTPYDTIYLDDLRNFNKSDHYTHLMISGSTESATEENAWYRDLDAIIHRFRSDEKSILGICFGHQYLVRHILGKEHIRKSSTPEIGWTDITLSNNPIFRKINSFKSAVFHYDEVFDLDNRFEITASSDRCAIHGFQIKGKPIWGVQFHPDFMYQDVFAFAEEARKKDDQFDKIHCRTATSQDEFRVNDQVFKNWVKE